MKDFDDDVHHTAFAPRRRFSAFALTLAAMLAAAGVMTAIGRSPGKFPADLNACLNEARKANAGHDLERERAVLTHAEDLDGSAEDAAEVQRRLAVLDWKYHARFDTARERLLAATSGGEPTEAWLALARLEQARKDFAAAHEAAKKAAAGAETTRERQRTRVVAGRAVVGAAMAARFAGEVGTSADLDAVLTELSDLIRQDSGELESSRLLLRAALILGDGEAAVTAWHSYFHVAPGHELVANAVADAGAELERLCADWDVDQASSEARIALVKALGDSRFFAEAALVATDPRAGADVRADPDVAEIVAYAAMIERLRAITEEYYRQLAIGKGKKSKYEEAARAQLRDFVGRFAPGEADSEDDVEKDLDRRFGTYVNFGKTAGFFDLHMGHRVVDRRRTVEQYGERADLRFVALDNMVSNGFQSWAWEHGGQHGGWAHPDTIFQVRPAYAGGAIADWRDLNDPNELGERQERIARESALDDDRARENPYAYLPGLIERLEYQGLERLLASLRAEGLTGEDLRLRFIADLEHSTEESSIFAHEGRHAIDKLAGESSSRSLEFTAKLSEAAFAPHPRLALGAILSATIDDGTPHGWANLKVRKGLHTWMDEHRDEIDDFDPERPLLPQFDRLTDEQIRAAFRSMDPLYKKIPKES